MRETWILHEVKGTYVRDGMWDGAAIWEKCPWQSGSWAGAGILGKEYTRRVDMDYSVN